MVTSKQRLVMTLAAAGVPANNVTLTGPTSAEIVWYTADDPQGEPTQAQIDLGAATLAAFDWSDEAQVQWERDQITEIAKGIVLTATDAQTRATKAACIALMISLQESRGKDNEMIARLNTLKAIVSPDLPDIVHLETGDSFEAAFQQVVQVLDAGYA